MNIQSPYKMLHGFESIGSVTGELGIKIMIAKSGLIDADLQDDELLNIAYKALDDLKNQLIAVVIARDPEAQVKAKREREELLELFGDRPIFVEAIPNGYWNNDGHFRHLPWFIVTTSVGRIKIGWRKHVINIDWTETVGTRTAEELFPSESVTKGERMIHAYGYGKARQYVEAIHTGEAQ